MCADLTAVWRLEVHDQLIALPHLNRDAPETMVHQDCWAADTVNGEIGRACRVLSMDVGDPCIASGQRPRLGVCGLWQCRQGPVLHEEGDVSADSQTHSWRLCIHCVPPEVGKAFKASILHQLCIQASLAGMLYLPKVAVLMTTGSSREIQARSMACTGAAATPPPQRRCQKCCLILALLLLQFQWWTLWVS